MVELLVVNSGSSSLKLALFRLVGEEVQLVQRGGADGIGGPHARFASQVDALHQAVSAMSSHRPLAPTAIGHRVVHGGPHLRSHQRITPDVEHALERALHFAPLHIPNALALVRASAEMFPGATQLACFDTAFHASMPEVAARLPLPARYFDDGVRRYGFHGLSCESLVRRLGTALPARAIFAHLGNGSSVTAVRDGGSIDTSMGLTPTGGMLTSTRTGDLDPGVLLYLLREGSLDADALETLVNRASGLAGLANGETDMRALLEREGRGDHAAQLAIEAYCTAARKLIGGYAALLGGVDLLVFTGGIGEHAPLIRARILAGLGFLGLAEGSAAVRVMPSEEEEQIAHDCAALLAYA